MMMPLDETERLMSLQVGGTGMSMPACKWRALPHGKITWGGIGWIGWPVGADSLIDA